MRRLLEQIKAVLAIGMMSAGVASCESADKNSPEPHETRTPFSVTVNFGDGEETWVASSANWGDHISDYNEVNFHFESEDRFPIVMGSIIPVGETSFPSAWEENEYLFFEYYSKNWEKIGSALWDYQLNIPYGDWQVDSGVVHVDSLDETTLSGTADLLMYDLVAYAIEMNDSPAIKPLKVTFKNVPLNVGTRSGAIRGALEAPDHNYSFSGERTAMGRGKR